MRRNFFLTSKHCLLWQLSQPRLLGTLGVRGKTSKKKKKSERKRRDDDSEGDL